MKIPARYNREAGPLPPKSSFHVRLRLDCGSAPLRTRGRPGKIVPAGVDASVDQGVVPFEDRDLATGAGGIPRCLE
jgi:hypothetical protein